MKKILTTLVFFISLIVSTLIAVNISSFLESDACVDAGGSYQALTGLCNIDRSYIPLFSRAGLYLFWFLFVMLVNIPALIAFYLLKYLEKNSKTVRGNGSGSEVPPHFHAVGGDLASGSRRRRS